ncbi:hypothetical protein H2198_000469 [Neophaeococcomyces mojaviensis]|uniref:Uncharacterized protein n=1 Tax=Neophaeococcomyces mojaviensis TaxID=3383035 RepID=A0ACC3AJJ9_9EURO|nr:hypothetical protein H2198_000469 [Knufia sp. JES_112]
MVHSLSACLTLFFTSFAITATAGKVTNPNNVPKNAILLSNVESLTFRSGKMTTSRRVAPVPQLTCTGPSNVCKLYDVDTMRCTNEGADYDAENIQWACKASLPEEFKLGATEVACEGYASSDDPYVLKGSCGVEYRLLLTDKGEQKFGKHNDDFPWNGSGDEERGTSTIVARVIFFAIFGAVLFIIVSRMLEACRRNPPRLGRNAGGRPWFGGGGDDDEPPPPYDSHGFNQPRKPKTTNYGTNNGSSSRGGQQQNQGWRPGPWSAGLAGAGLGYALGRNQNRTQPRQTQRPGGGFFGNVGGGSSGSWDSGPSRSSGPSSSGSRYESTGFGGTSRR